MANINDKLLVFMRVIEIDMSYTYLIYFILIEMTALHEFAFLCSVGVQVVTFILVCASMWPESTEGASRVKKLFLVAGKIANVALTIVAFFQIFLSDHSFDIKEDIEEFLGYELTDVSGFNYTSASARAGGV